MCVACCLNNSFPIMIPGVYLRKNNLIKSNEIKEAANKICSLKDNQKTVKEEKND